MRQLENQASFCTGVIADTSDNPDDCCVYNTPTVTEIPQFHCNSCSFWTRNSQKKAGYQRRLTL